jgi:hypothetical protein
VTRANPLAYLKLQPIFACFHANSIFLLPSRHNKVEGFVKANPDVNGEPRDIEELARLGPCPFYLARDMASTADIVFMPYNYLVDGNIRGGLKMLQWQNAVLIFDEAHNVEVKSDCSTTTARDP